MMFKRALLFLAGPFIALFALMTPASAACTGTAVHGGSGHACYAILAGGWGTLGTWSATSGGLTCACTPTTGDDIVFDGNTPTGTYTDTALSLNSIDGSAAGSGVIVAGVGALTVTGNFFGLSSAMTWSATSTLAFTDTTTVNITTGGHTVGAPTFNGIGGDFIINDSLTTISSGTLTLTNGTLDCGTHTAPMSVGAFSSNNSNTRTLTGGSCAWTILAVAGSWDFTTTTGLTCTCSGMSVSFAGVPTGNETFNTGSQSFGAISVTPPASPINSAFLITGSPTFASLSLSANTNISPANGSTITLTNAPTFSGAASGLINIAANIGQAMTIAVSSGAPAISWVAMQGVTWTGTTGTATNSFNRGGTSGITISGPSAGGGGRIIGG